MYIHENCILFFVADFNRYEDNPVGSFTKAINADVSMGTGEFETINRIINIERTQKKCLLPCDAKDIPLMLVGLINTPKQCTLPVARICKYLFRSSMIKINIVVSCTVVRVSASIPNNVDQPSPHNLNLYYL